jgi:polyisoprenyl-phosphate glycosyltransferase
VKLVSVVTPCFNEEQNVRELYERVRAALRPLSGRYIYEHIFIDNASTDGTLEVLRGLADKDHNVKVIANQRNFGVQRSGQHAFLQARGDAVIVLAADLQDPPELIPQFLGHWQNGFGAVLGVKKASRESAVMFLLRTLYYKLIGRMADVTLIQHASGFGLYDKAFVDMVRALDDPSPYTRGLVAEFGFPCATVPYEQPARRRGVTKNNFYALYDAAMVGITSHSKIPLRVATIAGFALSAFSFLVAIGYFVYKLIFWNSFPVGIAPIVIGLFLSFSIQLFFLGVLGEYVAVIHTRVMKRPLVVEKERINFEDLSEEQKPGAQTS